METDELGQRMIAELVMLLRASTLIRMDAEIEGWAISVYWVGEVLNEVYDDGTRAALHVDQAFDAEQIRPSQ